jgi:hypothetical protein
MGQLSVKHNACEGSASTDKTTTLRELADRHQPEALGNDTWKDISDGLRYERFSAGDRAAADRLMVDL